MTFLDNTTDMHNNLFEGFENFLIINNTNNTNKFKEIIENTDKKKLIFIHEPIKNINWCGLELINSNKINIYFGCINNDLPNKKFKFPLYLIRLLKDNNYKFNKEYFKNIISKNNNYVKTLTYEELSSKFFCCLINNWDPDNVRSSIYNSLIKLGHITCPGKLFNNCSPEELNKLGNYEYIKKFIFNICSENFDNDCIPGWITEKLMNCCLGGAIPIFSGWFDEYDSSIFNKERIIFYNSRDLNSIHKAIQKIKLLLSDNKKLLEFYRKPVFTEKAADTIEYLYKNYRNIVF